MKKVLSILLIALLITISGCIKIAPKATSTLNEDNLPISMKLSERVYVEIDPRVELVEIIYRISGVEWYRENVDPSRIGISKEDYPYIRDIDLYFEKYRDLKAVKMVSSMVRMGLTYDAIPKFALHLNMKNFSKAKDWEDMLKSRVNLDMKKLDEFAEAIAEFANKTNFWKFYNEHGEFYNSTLQEFVTENKGIAELVQLEEEFFGERASSWHIILQPTFCCHGYAYYFQTNDGKHVYAFLGIESVVEGIPLVKATSNSSSFLAHEFAHSFVNPAVDKHYNLFAPYASLYEPVSRKLSSMAYPNFRVMLRETFVRAFEVYYLNVTGGEDIAKMKLNQESKVFYFIGDVYSAYVNEYIKHRDKYRTFEDFRPELARVIAEVYEKTNGGKNVVLPLTVRDFMESAKIGGAIIAYSDSPRAKRLAEIMYTSLKEYSIQVSLKKVSAVKEDDLKRNLVLVLFSNETLLSELQNNALVVVNGTRVYSKRTGKSYSGSLRVLEVIKNPWNPRSVIMLVIGTDDSAFNKIHAYINLSYSIRDSSDNLLESW
ncbi:DUF4932 domain-containing protein [Pyrococcus abyssi]|nr:DUF4932 domain-containing protein [Pyrococcus abyssi]CCE70296.1 TPA: hypothetical protein PAB1767 [Pyrococcus abyssi GE5]